jgi:hypothetical protein
VSFTPIRAQSDQALRFSCAHRSEARWAESYEGILSIPEPAMTVALMTVQPDKLPCSLNILRTITRAGRRDGFRSCGL